MSERKKSISIPNALTQQIGRLGLQVLTRYELALSAWRLYKDPTQASAPLRVHRDELDRAAFSRIESIMVQNGMLSSISGLPNNAAYTIIGVNVTDPKVIACEVDPFCYISHLSAMEFHGITDRMPERVYVSTPPSSQWSIFAEQRMKRDLGEDFNSYLQACLPSLQRITIDRIHNRSVYQFKSLHLGAFRHVKDQNIRVSTLGRTFLDMLREPALCGGISHVIDCFSHHAKINKRLILDEIDQHGSAIDKVRAGWILETACDISDPRIDSWVKYTQRGGSRKLDPKSEYSPNFSERWAISINIPIDL